MNSHPSTTPQQSSAEGTPEFLRGPLYKALDRAHLSPSQSLKEAVHQGAQYLGITPEMLFLGSSTEGQLYTIAEALGLEEAASMGVATDLFTRFCKVHYLQEAVISASERAMIERGATLSEDSLLYIDQGGENALPYSAVATLVSARPDLWVVLDESAIEYTPEGMFPLSSIAQPFPRNLILLRSGAEFYGIKGVGLAYAIAHSSVIELLQNSAPEESVSSLTLAAFTAINSAAGDAYRAKKSREGTQVQHRSVPSAHRAKSLMIQGISSDAGKSIITAAFCRIFQQDGIKVAPFKAQNMALNSAVTPAGLEIGRAQAVQAQACKVEPDVRMNPLLLKPHSDTGAQVVLHGKAQGQRDAKEFHGTKERFEKEVHQAYDDLAEEYELIILEGAGSPGEVNLKENDIVNMAMARHAQSKVLLVGDIDRGGVYASFLGTYHTFDLWEKELLAGFLVNRFRGDSSLLDPAHDYLSRYTGTEVVGVVPFIAGLNVPDEDSVALDVWAENSKNTELDIALIHLPHISNFTDFAPLGLEPDVGLRLIKKVEEFDQGGTPPDLIILPGSKSVITDLAILREHGFNKYLQNYVACGGELLGVCGGLQMCGTTIDDPAGVEGGAANTKIKGFDFIPLETTLAEEKKLTQEENVEAPFGCQISGYEIHHGETVVGDAHSCEVTFRRSDGSALGYTAGNITTTYLHGLFDHDHFRHAYCNNLRGSKGLAPLPDRPRYDVDKALDHLAAVVRESVDMQQIYAMLELEPR